MSRILAIVMSFDSITETASLLALQDISITEYKSSYIEYVENSIQIRSESAALLSDKLIKNIKSTVETRWNIGAVHSVVTPYSLCILILMSNSYCINSSTIQIHDSIISSMWRLIEMMRTSDDKSNINILIADRSMSGFLMFRDLLEDEVDIENSSNLHVDSDISIVSVEKSCLIGSLADLILYAYK